MRGVAPGLHLGVDRPGDLVTRQQLRRAAVVGLVVVPAVALLLGGGVLVLEHLGDVVEHEPLALGVAQHPAVTAYGLGDQDAAHGRRPDHARRVELDELHVDQLRPGEQRERVPVTGVLPGVGGHGVGLADAAGGEDDRGRVEADETAGLAPVAEGPADGGVLGGTLLEQLGDRALGEDLDVRLGVAVQLLVLLLEGDDPLLEGADQLQARTVADVGEPGVLVAAEVALADLAVLGAVEQRAPGLQLPDAVGGLLGVQLGHPPVVEELPAAHGVTEVHHPVVVGIDVAHGRGGPALGHDRVGLAEQGLADDGGALPLLPGLDCRPESGAARSDDDDVVFVTLDFH